VVVQWWRWAEKKGSIAVRKADSGDGDY